MYECMRKWSFIGATILTPKPAHNTQEENCIRYKYNVSPSAEILNTAVTTN